jgi:SAM-dependent methyltransferase/GT2 family glycosyltransferase
MKVTGERVVTPSGGFNPAWQRHVAEYVILASRLGPGRVLDVGCGVGHSYHHLAPRETVGIDIDPGALLGQDRETIVADMRELPFAGSSFASIVSVHSLEHVPNPERVVAEAARVLEPGGTAAFVTPNRLTFGRSDEIIDPYHYVEFDREQLARLCRRAFEEVEVLGVFGSERYMELFDEERATLDRLLRLDPVQLRRFVPRRARQRFYDALLRHYRPPENPRAEAITPDDFELRDSDLDRALDLVALCRAPLRGRADSTQRVFLERDASAHEERVVVVMPARQAARTLEDTFGAIPQEVVDEVILVDDYSTDETVELARRLPLRLIWHPHQVGYGGNQKTCYMDALQTGADVVVMLHPDGQYEPELIPSMVAPILAGEADMVLGSRLLEPGAALAAGMPRWKYVANRALTTVENAIMGTRLSEAHTGYRAYSRDLLLTVPFLRNSLDFAFDSELLMQAAHFGFRIEEVPARCRYFEDASSVKFQSGVVYGLKTLWIGVRLILHRSGIVPCRKFRA